MSEIEERARVVQIALSWQRTPFHDSVGIKGVGADCAWYPFRVYLEAGLIPEFKVPDYSPQFLLHNSDEIYLRLVEQYAVRVHRQPRQADFLMYWFAKCHSHGAIVVDWPSIIHARKPVGVTLDDALDSHLLMYLDKGSAAGLSKRPDIATACRMGDPRPMSVYSLKSWEGMV